MHNQFKSQKFKHLMLAMGPRDLNSAPYSPVHCSSHSMTSFQSSELTELPVVENGQLFAQRVHSARTAHGTPPLLRPKQKREREKSHSRTDAPEYVDAVSSYQRNSHTRARTDAHTRAAGFGVGIEEERYHAWVLLAGTCCSGTFLPQTPAEQHSSRPVIHTYTQPKNPKALFCLP